MMLDKNPNKERIKPL